MASGYTVSLYRFLQPNKKVAERYKKSKEEIFSMDSVEFITARTMFRSKTGRGLIVGLPQLLTTETIVYDDTAAILRMSDTYKELIKIMSEEDILKTYLPSITSMGDDGWEATIFKRGPDGKWITLEDTVKCTGDIPVYVSEELGFYVKHIRSFGKCIFNKILTAHPDFKNSGDSYIYAYTPSHFRAMVSCLKDEYKGGRYTLDATWETICRDYNFVEVSF